MTIISTGFLLAPIIPRVTRTVRLTLSGSPSEGSLEVWRRDDTRVFFHARDAAGDPVDISGATEIVVSIARRLGSDLLLRKARSEGGVTVGADHVFTIDLTSAESAALPPGYLRFEAWVVSATGRQTVFGGHLIVNDTGVTTS